MRWVWITGGLLFAAGIVYLFWPAPTALDQEKIVVIDAQHLPKKFILKTPDLVQAVDGDTVTLNDLPRAASGARVGQLWRVVGELPVIPGKYKDGVTADQLGAYGIDDRHDLTALDLRLHLRWGFAGNTAYVWDGIANRLYVLPGGAGAMVARLAQAAGRLDNPVLFTGGGDCERIDDDGTVVALTGPTWAYPLHDERPACGGRVSSLIGNLAKLSLDDLTGESVAGLVPAATVKLWMKAGASATAAALLGPGQFGDFGTNPPTHTLAFYKPADGVGAIVQVDALPAQRLAPDTTASVNAAIAALKDDVLMDRGADDMGLASERLVFEKDGVEWFSLLQHFEDRMRPTWELTWQGGRETASNDTVKRLMQAMTSLTVTDPRREVVGGTPTAASAPVLASGAGTGALRIRIVPKFSKVESALVLTDREASANGVRGKIARIAPLLTHIAPEQLLDHRLFDQSPDRATKLQREDNAANPALKEVLTAGADGTWARTWPDRAAVDQVAVGRVLGALCGAEASAITLLKPGQAPPGNPEFSVAVRFAPTTDALKQVEVAMEETLAQERGLDFYQVGDSWQAWEIDRGMVWTLPDDLVTELRAPLQSDLLLPLATALVTKIELDDGQHPYALARGANGWAVGKYPADELEVRRLLRSLAGLRILDRQPKASPVIPAEAVLRVTCTLPGDGTDGELLNLMIARPTDGGTLWTSVESTRDKSPVPAGRCRIPDDQLTALAAPAARFIGAANAAELLAATPSATAAAPATTQTLPAPPPLPPDRPAQPPPR